MQSMMDWRQRHHLIAQKRAELDAARRYVRIDGPQPSAVRTPQNVRDGVPCRERNQTWLARQASKALSMATVLASMDVSDAEFSRRQGVCDACLHCTITEDGRHFCECCGCGHWAIAELSIKNRKEGWACPDEPARF